MVGYELGQFMWAEYLQVNDFKTALDLRYLVKTFYRRLMNDAIKEKTPSFFASLRF